MVGEDDKAERDRIAAMGARFTNTEPPAPPAPVEKKRDIVTPIVLIGGIVALGLVIAAMKSIGDKPEAPAVAAAPVATPIETGPEPRITAIDGGDDAVKIAQLIAKKCARSVIGRSRDAWGASEIRVKKSAILHHGSDMDVWSLEVTMPAAYTDVVDGNTLWYQVTTDRARINATKDVAATMCGLKAHDLFVDL